MTKCFFSYLNPTSYLNYCKRITQKHPTPPFYKILINFPLVHFIWCLPPIIRHKRVLCDEELLHQITNEIVEIIDDENVEMESTEKKPPSKKALFEAVNLTKSFTLFQSDDLAKLLRKHTTHISNIIASSSREKQSTISTFFRPI